ncbi:paraoxonase [Apiospora arundinis]|uniref:Paraoxonase n=1 Tax=Apiospora arundinis TaxID=335852 RepID=A0ABR2JH02_9PEZI
MIINPLLYLISTTHKHVLRSPVYQGPKIKMPSWKWIPTVVAAISAIAVYPRIPLLQTFYYNHPDRLVQINNIGPYEIKFSDKLRSCEDVILIENKGVAIVGCDAGRERWNTVMGIFLRGHVPSAELYVYNYNELDDDKSLTRLQVEGYAAGDDLHTLGLAYDEATSSLFIANHRRDGPRVDVFHLEFESHTLQHIHSIQHPLIRGPNAIHLVNSHEFYVSNDHHFLAKDSHLLSTLETYSGIPTGTLVHVDMAPLLRDPSSTVDAEVVARLPFPNGIEFINEKTLAVASTNSASIRLYSVTPPTGSAQQGHPTLTFNSSIQLPFLPDNLSKASDGTLVIAGHPHAPSLGKFAATRHVCNSPEERAKAEPAVQELCEKMKVGSWVAQWTQAEGVKHLYAGTDFPTSCSAIRDLGRKTGIISGLYAQGLLVWRD